MNSLLSKNYADALLELAKETNNIQLYKEQLFGITNICDNNSDLVSFLNHPNILKEDKKNLIKQVISADKMIINFLMVLVDKNLSNYIFDITKQYNILANKELNIKMIDCVSANELDNNYRNDLEKLLSKKFNQEISINYSIDASLMAGIKLFVDDKVYDNSAKNSLNRIKEKVDSINLQIEV